MNATRISDHRRRRDQQGPEDRPVGEAPAQRRTDHHAHAHREQVERHPPLIEPGDVGDGRGDVGVHREHAAEADRPGEQGEQDLRVPERAQLTAPGRLVVGLDVRHQPEHQHGGQGGEPCHQPVRRTPAGVLAEPGGSRDPGNVGEGQTEHHSADRPATSLGSDQAGRHEGGHPEVGAVWDAGEEPGQGERGEAGRQGAGRVADQEDQHQPDQQLPAREPGAEHRDQRGADHHPDGVRRDHVAGRRDGHADPGGHLRQQPHRDELRGADREAAHRQREQGEADLQR